MSTPTTHKADAEKPKAADKKEEKQDPNLPTHEKPPETHDQTKEAVPPGAPAQPPTTFQPPPEKTG